MSSLIFAYKLYKALHEVVRQLAKGLQIFFLFLSYLIGLQPTGLQPTGLQPTGLQPTGLQPTAFIGLQPLLTAHAYSTLIRVFI